ncbi:L-glutamine-phosphate cytidylyltransferase [Methylomarinovum caldicuralii]|uniref:L-glutamine-phosphate cytidylyltransferase n=1 Tax=Methylomarinovum caldicuralii TaxID=438856 RepID=A0AAU9C6A6_9GAMM|nr:phosphocholine cytidylyltransferase family protein [Methylomarinovum caldicuralii]BCX82770.1 L-glutamine-phosphate cytidylyltransferase [Methylomarinovum caldicuralii]
MKAIILSAGQGTRLLPLTSDKPKCTLKLEGRGIIEWQIDALMAAGVHDIVVVAGYKMEKVRHLLDRRYGKGAVRIVFNPFYEVADNLASCWMVREEMTGDFLLINGDTLFEPLLAQRMIAQDQPITLARDEKPHYDDDDMKLILQGDRLLSIGKKLPLERVNGESIGMIRFRPEGADLFRRTIEDCMREPAALQRWYLSVIDEIAQSGQPVWTHNIHGLDWTEIDYPLDFKHAEAMVRQWDWGAAEEAPEACLSSIY